MGVIQRLTVGAAYSWKSCLTRWLSVWEEISLSLESLLIEHRVFPLAARLSPNLSPDFKWSLRALEISRQLVDLLQAFQQAEVQILPLKGPVLAYQLYGDIACRWFVDLDLLVFPKDLPRSQQILKALGYTRLAPRLERLPRHLQMRIRSRTHHEIWQPPSSFAGVPVELHWQLMDPRWNIQISVERVMQRAREIPWWGRRVWVMEPTDLLIYLAVHGAKHQWNRLLWLCDFTQAWAQYGEETDPRELLERARTGGVLRMLLLAFVLLRETLGISPPMTFKQELRKHQDLQNIARTLIARLRRGIVVTPNFWKRVSYEARLQDSGKRFNSLYVLTQVGLRWIAPSETDYRVFSLPHVLYPLYYGFRPLRGLFSWIRRGVLSYSQKLCFRRR